MSNMMLVWFAPSKEFPNTYAIHASSDSSSSSSSSKYMVLRRSAASKTSRIHRELQGFIGSQRTMVVETIKRNGG